MLSERPHLAGTEQNLELARRLTTFWTEQGLDQVMLTPYDVMLSYPNMSDPNYVELLDGNNSQVYRSNFTEAILTPQEDKPGVVPPFNAFSAPGDIKVKMHLPLSPIGGIYLICTMHVTCEDNVYLLELPPFV